MEQQLHHGSSQHHAAVSNLRGFVNFAKAPRTGRFLFLDYAYLVAFASLTISWLSPMHIQPWVTWHSEAVVFFGIFSAAGLVLLSKMGAKAAFDLPPVAYPLFLLFVLVFSQWLTGRLNYSGDFWIVSFYIALCLTCLALGFAAGGAQQTQSAEHLMQRHTPAIYLALVLLCIGIASVGSGLAQGFDVGSQSTWVMRYHGVERRPGGQIGQPNHFAIGLLMAVVSAVYLFTLKKLGGYSTLVVVAYLGLGIALGQSRNGLLGVAVVAVWWTWKQPVVAPLCRRWWGFVTLLLLVGLFVLWPLVFNWFYLDPERAASRLADASNPRLVVWRQLIDAVLARPWLGWGVLQVAEAHNSVLHRYTVSEPFGYSHNILLDLAVWGGIPVAIGFLVLVLFWLLRRARAVQTAHSWYLFGVVLPLGIGSLLEFPYAYAYFLAPVFFALGMLEGELRCRPIVSLPTRAAVLPFLVVSLLLMWSVVEYIDVEEDVRVVRFEALRIGRTPENYTLSHSFLLTHLSSLAASTRIVPVPGMSVEQISTLKNVALRYPWTATRFRYATALALNGDQPEALRQLQVQRVLQGEKNYLTLINLLGEKVVDHNIVWQPTIPRQ